MARSCLREAEEPASRAAGSEGGVGGRLRQLAGGGRSLRQTQAAGASFPLPASGSTGGCAPAPPSQLVCLRNCNRQPVPYACTAAYHHEQPSARERVSTLRSSAPDRSGTTFVMGDLAPTQVHLMSHGQASTCWCDRRLRSRPICSNFVKASRGGARRANAMPD